MLIMIVYAFLYDVIQGPASYNFEETITTLRLDCINTLIYKLYWYVQCQRIWFLSCFRLK